MNVIAGTDLTGELLDARRSEPDADENEMYVVVEMRCTMSKAQTASRNPLCCSIGPSPSTTRSFVRHAGQFGRFDDGRRHLHGRSDDGDARSGIPRRR